tara:strand:+ start:4264 stop:4479 length:216 start_codon:yes stop_codon:yes gene_type:complete
MFKQTHKMALSRSFRVTPWQAGANKQQQTFDHHYYNTNIHQQCQISEDMPQRISTMPTSDDLGLTETSPHR